jgi:hypothetical protein
LREEGDYERHSTFCRRIFDTKFSAQVSRRYPFLRSGKGRLQEGKGFLGSEEGK